MYRWNRPIHEENLWLLFPSEFDELPDGTVLLSISGDTFVKGKDNISLDTRGGFLAYGLTPNMAESQGLQDKFLFWMLCS